MASFFQKTREHFSFLVISSFWLINLVNPIFKKYDYGAEFPLVCAFGVLLLFVGIAEWKRKREKNWLETGLLLTFGAAVVVSFIFSQTRNVGYSEVLAFLSMIPLYLFLGNQKLEWQKKFLKVVLVGLFFAVIQGFILYFLWPENRMVGPFFNIIYHANMWPNAFGLFLLLTWPLLMLDFKMNRILKIAFLSVTFAALLLTFSRGALIAFGGQLFLILIYFAKRIRLQTVVTIIVTAVLSIGTFWLANEIRDDRYAVINVEERVTFSNNESLTSKTERQNFWAGAIQLIKEKPLFGWGPFSFRYAYNPIQVNLLGNSDHPHNIFLKIGAENGLIALGAFVAFLLAIFIKVAARFTSLQKEKRDYIYILGVAVAGAFAHNLIDYNFNFFTNLLLLFIFIIFIRSSIIKEDLSVKKPIVGLVLSVFIAIISFYEGSLLVLDKLVFESPFMHFTMYPRNYYPELAEKFIKKDLFEIAYPAVKTQIALNPLDSQAWLLKANIECKKNEFESCLESLNKAIDLNPKNDLNLYVAYFRALANQKTDSERLQTTVELLEEYFAAVQNNIHFTAYSTNVEAAAELTDILVNDFNQSEELLVEKEKMLEKAKQLRAEKGF